MRARLKWVNTVRKIGGRKGTRVLYYWRRPGHPVIRLPDNPGSAEFVQRVMMLNIEADKEDETISHAAPGSFRHLVEMYLASPDFAAKAEETRRGYRDRLQRMERKFGDEQLCGITRQVVYKYRDSMRANPHQANAMIRVLRLLLNFAVDRGILAVNPALSPRQMLAASRKAVWSPEAEAAWLGHAGETMRLAYMLAAYTAQRQNDILEMSWNQYNGETISLRQHKTGTLVDVHCHHELRSALNNAKRRGAMMLLTESGRPFAADHFRHEWRKVSVAADISSLQFRDLRRTAMVRLAEAGATTIEIAAISGHQIQTTQRILDVYIPRNAAMGKAGIIKLENRARRTSND